MTLSRNLALSATKISADGDIDYNNLLNKPTIPSVAGLASTSYVDTSINNLVNGAPAALNTLKEIADQLAVDESATAAIVTTLGTKANTSSLSTVATTGSYNDLTNKPTVPTNTTQLTNGAGFITASDASITGKQATLVSGTNIKTVNGTSLLGSGDLVISGGGGGGGTTTNKLKLGVGIGAGVNGDWLSTLYEPTRASSAYFGTAVAANDTYIVVGVENKTTSTGVVYIYNANTYALMYTLTNPASATSSKFGNSVAINGNYLVVGSYYATGTNAQAGKIYYYDISTFTAYSGTPITVSTATWTVTDPNYTGTDSSDYFGWRVGVTSSYVVASAYNENTSGGAVYIFNRTNGTLLYTLTDPNPYSTVNADYFGYSLAINGNTLVVGAYQEEATDASSNSGRAYVYDISTFAASPATVSTPTLTLNNPSSVKSSDWFGFSVAVNSTYVAVGAQQDSPQIIPSGSNNATTWSYMGSVYVFNKTTGALVYTLYPSVYGTYQGFGYNISMNETHLLAGSWYQDSADLGGHLIDLSTGLIVKTYYNASKESTSVESDAFGKFVALSTTKAVLSSAGDHRAGVGNFLGSVQVFSAVDRFDGSSEVTIGLNNTSVVPSSYGSISGNVAYIPTFTVDKYGRIINASTNTFVTTPGISNAYSNLYVNDNLAYSASGTDNLNFKAGTNVTLTPSLANGRATVTIDVTIPTSGGSGSTATTLNLLNIYYNPMSNSFALIFNNSTDASSFASGIGSATATVTGYTASNVVGGFPTSFTVSGTWVLDAPNNAVSISAPTFAPNIAMYLNPSSPTSWSANAAMTGSTTVSFTGGGASASGPTWVETTMSSFQGGTPITYTKPSSGSARIYVAFYSPNAMSSWIQSPPGSSLSWSNVAGTSSGFIVFSANITSSFIGSGETWQLNNNEHMLYTTWTVTDSAIMEQGESGYGGGGSAMVYTSSLYTKTHYFMVGSINSQYNASTSSALSPAPSGYSFKSGKVHSQAAGTSVGFWSNPTPTSGSHSFSSSGGYSYNYGSIATAS